MSSLAQEESRSISGNVTWGKRKAFQDGKVSLPYKTFLGYKKGEDGLPEIVEKEADLVRRIYRMFLSGINQSSIAKTLIKEKIPTPGGKTHWQYSTIDSILRNEKYKGSALLQKRYTVDFLTKKVKKNEGEVNQYYVDESHEGIIDKDDWDIVQAELYEKEKIPTKSRSYSVLAGKIICGCCGKVYGSKVWHSTDKYRKVIWQCNNKYNGDVCTTPNIDEKAVKSLYLKALEKLLDDKEKLIDGLIYVRDNVFSDDFIKEMDDTKNELDLISAGIRKHIDDNARKESDVNEYMNYYKELTIRYTRTQDKWNDLLREEVNRRMKVIKINGMIKEIKDLNKLDLKFNDRLFNLTISHHVSEYAERNAAEDEQGNDVCDGRNKGVREYRGVDVDGLCKDRDAASHDFCHDHRNGDRNGNGQCVKEGIFVAEDQTVDQLQFRKAYDADGDRHEHRDAQFLPDDFQDVSRPYFVERHASDHGNGCLAARIAARTHDHGHARHKQGP